MSIRTNAHPVILTSAPRGLASHLHGVRGAQKTNLILDLARDYYDSADLYGWAMGTLYAVEVLRMEYDSPRIGGGIDPAIASNLNGESIEYDILRGELEGLLFRNPGLFTDAIQDMIVHAEAVLDRLIQQCRINGKDY